MFFWQTLIDCKNHTNQKPGGESKPSQNQRRLAILAPCDGKTDIFAKVDK